MALKCAEMPYRGLVALIRTPSLALGTGMRVRCAPRVVALLFLHCSGGLARLTKINQRTTSFGVPSSLA